MSLLPRWEHFPHEADVGVRGLGGAEADAFVQAALALTAITVDPGSVRLAETIEIVCEAPDNELLLVDWLNALVYESSSRGFVFGAFEVQLEKGRLRAHAHGEKIDPERHQLGVEVKGATYTSLSVRRETDGTWVAQCVVDV